MSSSRPSRYIPEIDGLRALAVLAVILHHIDLRVLPGGYLGVDIFFVISGYVITASMAARAPCRDLGGMLRDFYARRVRRLLPALLVCVLVTGLLACLFDPYAGVSLRTGIAALLGYANIHLSHEGRDYFSRASELNAFTHTWSLGVEEQFYLLFPLLLWFSGFLRGDPRGRLRLGRLLTVVGATSLLSFLVLSAVDPRAAFYQMPSRFWELAAGSLVFLHCGGASPADAPRSGGLLRPLPIVLLLLAALALPPEAAAVATPAMVLLTSLLLAAMARRAHGPVRTLLALPWLVFVGQLSYSLYLWHWPVLSLSRWTIGISAWTVPLLVVLMAVLAVLSHRWIETPLRRSRGTPRRLRTIAVGLMAVAASAGLLHWIDRDAQARLFLGDSSGPPPKEAWDLRAIPGTAISPDNCERNATTQRMPEGEEEYAALLATCTAMPAADARPAGAVSPHLYLVGDSHAMAFSPVLAHALKEGRHPVTLLSRTGCPFPDPPHGHTDRSCSGFQRRLEDHILRRASPGDVVVITDYLLSHLGDSRNLRDTRDDILGPDGRVRQRGEEKRALFVEGLHRLGERFSRRGIQVVLVGETPRHPDRAQCYPHWFNLRIRSTCERTVAMELAHAREMNRILRRELPPTVRFFDPLPVLCSGGCSHSQVLGILRDTDHLSIDGARRLADPFLRFLRESPG